MKNSFSRVKTSSMKNYFPSTYGNTVFDGLLINFVLIMSMMHFISAASKCISTRKLCMFRRRDLLLVFSYFIKNAGEDFVFAEEIYNFFLRTVSQL